MKRTLIAIVIVAVIAAGVFLVFKGTDTGRKETAVTAPEKSLSAEDLKINRLTAELQDPDPEVRIKAINAAADMTDPRLLAPLTRTLDDNEVRVRAAGALALGHYPKAVSPLVTALENDPATTVRANAAASLGKMTDKQIVGPLVEAVQSAELPIRGAATDSLLRQASLFDDTHTDTLVGYLEGENVWLKRMAAQALARITDPRTVDPLMAALKEKDSTVRAHAARGLGVEKAAAAVAPLTRLLNDPDWRVKAAAADALGDIGDKKAVRALVAMLKNRKSAKRALEKGDRGIGEAMARKAMCTALGKLSDPRAASTLADRIARGSGPEKIAAAEALCRMARANSDQTKNPAADILKKTAGNLRIDPKIRASLNACATGVQPG